MNIMALCSCHFNNLLLGALPPDMSLIVLAREGEEVRV